MVEDDEISCELFRELFDKANIKHFLIVNNGEEAVEVCKKNHAISLVLMDIKLPGINGHEAMMKIKKARGKLPVVAQTACVSQNAKEVYNYDGDDDDD